MTQALSYFVSVRLIGMQQATFAERPRLREKAPTFSIDSPVVLLPVTVMDGRGSLLAGLSRNSFVVVQDNQRQQITSFAEEDMPASMGIVFDTSGSMSKILGKAKLIVRSLLGDGNPDDEAFLYTVSTRPGISGEFTSDVNTLLSRTEAFTAHGSTALIDTVFAALHQSHFAHHPRKALVIISDGMDNHSRVSKSELIHAAIEADVQIYSISIFDAPLTKKAIELDEERRGLFLLGELSQRTGGFQIVIRNYNDIAGAAARIGHAIRNEYMIGFVPNGATGRGKWHSINIKLNLPHAHAYTRSGFFMR